MLVEELHSPMIPKSSFKTSMSPRKRAWNHSPHLTMSQRILNKRKPYSLLSTMTSLSLKDCTHFWMRVLGTTSPTIRRTLSTPLKRKPSKDSKTGWSSKWILTRKRERSECTIMTWLITNTSCSTQKYKIDSLYQKTWLMSSKQFYKSTVRLRKPGCPKTT